MSQPSPTMSTVQSQPNEEHRSMQLRDVTFRVEDRRFRVPIQLFDDSETFHAMLENATTNDPEARQTIHLDGISTDEFLYFLRYMNQRRLGGQLVINAVGYAAVLKISTKWGFKTVRATAIRDFPDVDVVDKIVLARDYCVREWIVESLNKYAQLGRSITLDDVERLGVNYILRITQLRENFLQDQSFQVPTSTSYEAHQRRTYDFKRLLEELFHEEIERSNIQLPPTTLTLVEDFDLVDIYFLVEGRLFKSYRQCFEDSPVFQTMFSLPAEENNVEDGSTKSQPLHLEGIAGSDFAPFVDLMNPGASPEMDFSLAEWISILKLSTMWEFNGARQYAIAQILKLGMSSARQINLARDYHVQEWFLPGLMAYAQQTDPITADDVDLLGWEFVLKLLQARERMGNITISFNVGDDWSNKRKQFLYKPGIEARVTNDFKKAIEKAFQDEIERMLQMYPE